MSNFLTSIENIISIISMIIVGSAPITVPLIFFIVYLVRFLKTPEDDTEKRKKYRKAFTVPLIIIAVFAALIIFLFFAFAFAFANM